MYHPIHLSVLCKSLSVPLSERNVFCLSFRKAKQQNAEVVQAVAMVHCGEDTGILNMFINLSICNDYEVPLWKTLNLLQAREREFCTVEQGRRMPMKTSNHTCHEIMESVLLFFEQSQVTELPITCPNKRKLSSFFSWGGEL